MSSTLYDTHASLRKKWYALCHAGDLEGMQAMHDTYAEVCSSLKAELVADAERRGEVYERCEYFDTYEEDLASAVDIARRFHPRYDIVSWLLTLPCDYSKHVIDIWFERACMDGELQTAKQLLALGANPAADGGLPLAQLSLVSERTIEQSVVAVWLQSMDCYRDLDLTKHWLVRSCIGTMLMEKEAYIHRILETICQDVYASLRAQGSTAEEAEVDTYFHEIGLDEKVMLQIGLEDLAPEAQRALRGLMETLAEIRQTYGIERRCPLCNPL